MKTPVLRITFVIAITILTGIFSTPAQAQNLPVSDQFSLCATVDPKASQVNIHWIWNGPEQDASGYSVYPASGELITINNPTQTEASFKLEKNKSQKFYVVRQGLDGKVYRSNDVHVNLKKTSILELLVPGLRQSKKANVITSTCSDAPTSRKFSIDRPLLIAFGASAVAWGGLIYTKHNNRAARSNFLFEEDTRFTEESFTKWQDTFEIQQTVRDIAVYTTLATYAVHLVSLLSNRDNNLRPEISSGPGQLSLRNSNTRMQFGLRQNDPSLSLQVRF